MLRLPRRFCSVMIAALFVVPAAVIGAPTAAGALGPNAIRSGFATTAFPGNDDGSVTVALPFSVNFFGTTYNQLFLNNNGNLTFDAALADFTPFDLFNAGRVIIAPFFADVDTSVGATAAYGSSTVDGHNAWGVTWPGVGCFFQNTSVLNYFQVILIDRSDVAANAFDIEFNYDQIQWDSGQLSGGDANCLNGDSAHAGYSNGTAANSYELPGSGVTSAFLDSNASTGLVNNSVGTTQLGRYVFSVRNGQPSTPTTLTTSLSAGDQSGASVNVPPNTAVTDSATLSGTNAATATGSVTYTVFSDPSCDSSVASGGTKTVTAGSVPSSDPVSLADAGTYYWRATYTGDGLNASSNSTCGDEIETIETLGSLSTSIVGVPEPVTAGLDVQYTVTVTNNGATPVEGVQVVDTLPTGTTLFSASPGCVGTGPVTCSLGTIDGESSNSVNIVVVTPTSSAGTTITDSAVTTPGGSTATFDTHPTAATGDSADGFVPAGGSITTGGDNASTLSLPTPPGAFVSLDHVFGADFCNGTCTGPATFVNNFPGYTDAHHPIDLKLTLRHPNVVAALRDYAFAKGYKLIDDPSSPAFGTVIVIPDCKDNPSWTPKQKKAAALRRLLRVGTHSGIADPSPCIDGRTITRRRDGVWQTTFEILYLSNDGGFARR
jgi:uncharacterized repeat protein (TIGR01451 family)